MTVRPATADDHIFLTQLAVRYFGLVYPRIKPAYVAEYFRWCYSTQPSLLAGTLIAEQNTERIGAVTLRTPSHHKQAQREQIRHTAPPLSLSSFVWRFQLGLSKLNDHADQMAERVGILENLGVVKHFRRQGMGAALVRATLDAAKDAKLPEIRLWVASGAGLEAWYEKLGFQVVRRIISLRSRVFLGRDGWVEMRQPLLTPS